MHCCTVCTKVVPEGVKVTVVADRGFADCSLFEHLAGNLGFEYVIRLRGNIYVTNAKGEKRKASQWVGVGGRSAYVARCSSDR